MFKRLKEFFFIIFQWIKTLFVLLHGMSKIFKLHNPITFFGGSRYKSDAFYAKKAHHIAKYLVQNGVSVITGGGGGIMEAANCGATEAAQSSQKGIKSMAVGVKDLPKESQINACAQDYVILNYFFARKWLLMRYSKGFIIFPGGFGTIDEMTELLTLIQARQIKHVPIILFGNDYWKPFIDWINDFAVRDGLITQDEVNLLTITEDENEICSKLLKHCKICTEND